jgi:hypothetical protein
MTTPAVTMLEPTPLEAGPLAPVARIATGVRSEVDGLLFGSRTHWFLFWTLPVEGRRAVVGMEVRPIGDQSAEGVLRTWVEPRFEEVLASPPPPAQLTSSMLRHEIPVREIMRARGEAVASKPLALCELDAKRSAAAKLDRGDRRLVGRLLDALVYERAVLDHARPAVRIAEWRSISLRSAEGRIRSARLAGLLTPLAQGQHAAGGLTEKARAMAEILNLPV